MAKGSATWKRVKFGDITQCVNDRVDDPKSAGVDRYVGLEHLDPGSLAIRRWGTPDDVESTKLRFKPGDIIFGKRRAYQRKLAVADFEGICSAHAMVLRAKPDAVVSEFLPFFMQSDVFMERAIAISVGSLSPTINWKTLAAEEFALPPLEEQIRLVGHLEASRAAEVALTDLDEALGDAEAALSEHYATGLGAPVLPNGAIEASALPSNWNFRSIEWLASGREGCGVVIGPFGSALLIGDYNKLDSGTPVLFVGDVRRNRFRYESKRFVSAEKHRELAAHEARAGDVVCNKTGWPPGVTARLPADWPTSVITSHLVRIRLNPDRIDPDYFTAIMNSHWGQNQCVRLAPGTTRPQMTLRGYRAIRLAVPPRAEQLEFVQRFAVLAAQRTATFERLQATRQLVAAFATARMASQ